MELIEQAERELAYSRQVLSEGDPRRAQQHALAVQGDLIDTVLNAESAVDERRTARALYAEARGLAAEATSRLPKSDSRRRTIQSIIADATRPSRTRDVSHPSIAATATAAPQSVSADYGLN